MPVDKICEYCGVGFRVKPRDATQKCCTAKCKHDYEAIHGRLAAQVVSTEFACQQCRKPFFMKPSFVRAYIKKWGKEPMYCSTECGGLGRRLSAEAWNHTCIQCGQMMTIQRRPGGTVNRGKRLCSTACRSLFRRLSYRANNPDQQITRRIDRKGYVKLVIPGVGETPSHEIFEHRHVMEQHIGRKLRPEETVHHKDGNRQHNLLSNLELFSSNHGPGQRVIDKVAFAIEMLLRYPEFAKAAGVTQFEHVPVTASSAHENPKAHP